jgi:hypothetical protein
MQTRERDILERAVAAVTEQAAKADALIYDLKTAGLPEDGPILQAKLIRLELLKVKGDLERELGAGGYWTAGDATGGCVGWRASASCRATAHTRSRHRTIPPCSPALDASRTFDT